MLDITIFSFLLRFCFAKALSPTVFKIRDYLVKIQNDMKLQNYLQQKLIIDPKYFKRTLAVLDDELPAD